MNTKLLSVIIVLLISLSLIACSNTKKEESNIKLNNDFEEKSYEFLKALQEEDYETGLQMAITEDKTFITVEQFKSYIDNSEYSSIVGKDLKLTSSSTEINNDNATVKLDFDNGNTYYIKLVDCKTGSYSKISLGNSYVSNYNIIIPKDSKLKINDTEVNEQYKNSSENTKVYKIPALMCNVNIPITVETDFGTFEEMLNLQPKEKSTELNLEIAYDKNVELCNKVKELLENIDTLYLTNQTSEEYKEFISEDNFEKVYSEVKREMIESYKSGAIDSNSNIRYSLLQPSDEPMVKSSKVTSNKTIILRMKTEKKWFVALTQSEEQTRDYTEVEIEIVGDNIKLYNINKETSPIASMNSKINRWNEDGYIEKSKVDRNIDATIENNK